MPCGLIFALDLILVCFAVLVLFFCSFVVAVFLSITPSRHNHLCPVDPTPSMPTSPPTMHSFVVPLLVIAAHLAGGHC